MYARAVDEAGRRSRELYLQAREDWAAASVALVLAFVATEIRTPLAISLLVGGVVVGALGAVALVRRHLLIAELARDRAAYSLPEVKAYGARTASMPSRRRLAAGIRGAFRHPGVALADRIAGCADELQALADELDDDSLSLDPVSAVACVEFLTDGAESPLFNPVLPADEARSYVWRIRAGFERQLAA